MLRMEVIVHDQLWPQLTIIVTRQSYRNGQIVQTEKKSYDLSYVKLEEMLHNHARPLVEEIISRHQRGNQPSGG